MATYGKNCMYCQEIIPGDSAFCPLCGHTDPFSLLCPQCKNGVQSTWKICSSCGFRLHVTCPECGKETFANTQCDYCKSVLMVRCTQKKCQALQVMAKDKLCLFCGKPLR